MPRCTTTTATPSICSPLWSNDRVGVSHSEHSETGTQRFALWVYVDDCDALVETSRAAGVTILAEPVDQPWGERVARVADPDGNVVIIGARGEIAPDE